MAKIDLTSFEWCELIFKGKNKAYGAYKMRADSRSVLPRKAESVSINNCFKVISLFSNTPESIQTLLFWAKRCVNRAFVINTIA